MIVHRLAREKWSKNLNASGRYGRWNEDGQFVLYCSESIPLAFLELMAQMHGTGYTRDFFLLDIEIPDHSIITLLPSQLPSTWRGELATSGCSAIGSQWYRDQASVALRVPTALVERSYNLVLNTAHPSFSEVRLVESHLFEPDERLEKLIRGEA